MMSGNQNLLVELLLQEQKDILTRRLVIRTSSRLMMLALATINIVALIFAGEKGVFSSFVILLLSVIVVLSWISEESLVSENLLATQRAIQELIEWDWDNATSNRSTIDIHNRKDIDIFVRSRYNRPFKKRPIVFSFRLEPFFWLTSISLLTFYAFIIFLFS